MPLRRGGRLRPGITRRRNGTGWPGTLARHGRALRIREPGRAIPRGHPSGAAPITGFDADAGACARNGLTLRDSGLRHSRGSSGPGHARRSLAREPTQLVAQPLFPVAARRRGTRSQPPQLAMQPSRRWTIPVRRAWAALTKRRSQIPRPTTTATDRGARADGRTHRPCPGGMPAPISPWSRG